MSYLKTQHKSSPYFHKPVCHVSMFWENQLLKFEGLENCNALRLLYEIAHTKSLVFRENISELIETKDVCTRSNFQWNLKMQTWNVILG